MKIPRSRSSLLDNPVVSRALAFIFFAGLASFALGAPYGGADYAYEQGRGHFGLGGLLLGAIVFLLYAFMSETETGAAILYAMLFIFYAGFIIFLLWAGIQILALDRDGSQLIGFGVIGFACFIVWRLSRKD